MTNLEYWKAATDGNEHPERTLEGGGPCQVGGHQAKASEGQLPRAGPSVAGPTTTDMTTSLYNTTGLRLALQAGVGPAHVAGSRAA